MRCAFFNAKAATRVSRPSFGQSPPGQVGGTITELHVVVNQAVKQGGLRLPGSQSLSRP